MPTETSSRDALLGMLYRADGPIEDVPSRLAIYAPSVTFDPVALNGLVEEGCVVHTPTGWLVTEPGRPVAEAAMKRAMQSGFDDALVVYAASPAFLEYCRQVYEFDRFAFNMVDRAQRDRLLDAVGLKPGDTFLDLGCATGSYTRWIAEQTGASGFGIDFAPKAIEMARALHPSARFDVQDMDALDLPDRAFAAVVAIDTLYFASDLQATVRAAWASLEPGGRFVAFWGTTADPGQTPPPLAETSLGRALEARTSDVESVDVTESLHHVWRRAVDATVRLEAAFIAEDLHDLWRSRLSEATHNLEKVVAGRKRRWLVTARRPGGPQREI